MGECKSTQRSRIRWVKIFIERTDWGKEAYRRIFELKEKYKVRCRRKKRVWKIMEKMCEL